MRFFLLIIVCFSSVFASCQNKVLNQNELSEKFNKDWCDCLKKQSKGKTPEEIIEQTTINCVLNVMTQYTEDKQLYDNMRMLIAAKGYDDSLSDYEKERLFGRELGNDLMRDAVDNCVVFRKALIEFKKYYIEKAQQAMGVDDEKDLNEWLDMMQKELDEIDINQVKNVQTRKRISNYYVLMGLVYENIKKESLAIEQYDKAVQFDEENTNAMGFKKLLVTYKND